MAHIHIVDDYDRRFTIDPLTRKVTNNQNDWKNSIVQNDHNSERVTFELPRIIEGHDMCTCNSVQVHYINIDSTTKAKSEGVYQVDDLRVDPANDNIVVCSWLVSRNATKYKGLLSFVIRFVCTTDGNVDYAWNTTVCSDISVSDGIYNSDVVAEEYADVLEHWENRFNELVAEVRHWVEIGGASDDAIDAAVDRYLDANPVKVTGVVKSVNGATPDENGNVEVNGGGITVTARPGQIVLVKEVDEDGSPTAWEAVDRTHWKEVTQEAFDFNTDIAFFNVMASVNGLGTANVIEGKTYIVTWNGVPYECTAVMSGSIMLGNLSIMEMGNDTGEPFCMEMMTKTSAVVYKKSAIRETVVLNVHLPETVIWHTLDPRYIKSQSVDCAEYGLPVLALTGDVSAMTKDNAVPLTYQFKGRSGSCEVKWQGSSSIHFPKKNYTIKFDNAFEAVEGWGAQKKYCAKANYVDHSHARNVVSARMWGKMVNARHSNLLTDEVLNNVTQNLIREDGYLHPTPDWVTTEFLPVPGVSTLHLYYTSSNDITQCSYHFYDKYYNPIESLTNVWQQDNCDVEIPVPPKARYIRVAWSVTYSGATVTHDSFKLVPIEKKDADVSITETLKHLPNGGAIDGFPIIITINDDFVGLYTFNIPKDGWMFGMSDPTLHQAVVCADIYGDATRFNALPELWTDFELEYVSDEDDSDWVANSLNTLISAVMNSDGSDLDTTLAQYIDWDSVIDYSVLSMLVYHVDGIGKNYLLGTYDGTKWFMSAYDMDGTWGMNWDGIAHIPADRSGLGLMGAHRLLELVKNYKKEALKARYAEIRERIMSEDAVSLEFLTFTGCIPSTIFAEDAKKWPTIPSTSVSNVTQIMNWYRLRCKAIDEELDTL